MSKASKLVKRLNSSDIMPDQIDFLKSILPDSAQLLTDFYFDCGFQTEPWHANLKSEAVIIFSDDHSTIAFGHNDLTIYTNNINKWYTVRGNLGKYIAKHALANDLPTKRIVKNKNSLPYMRFKNKSKSNTRI